MNLIFVRLYVTVRNVKDTRGRSVQSSSSNVTVLKNMVVETEESKTTTPKPITGND
jgi:hypothetical protein